MTLTTPTSLGCSFILSLNEKEPGAARGPGQECQLDEREEEGNCEEQSPAVENVRV